MLARVERSERRHPGPTRARLSLTRDAERHWRSARLNQSLPTRPGVVHKSRLPGLTRGQIDKPLSSGGDVNDLIQNHDPSLRPTAMATLLCRRTSISLLAACVLIAVGLVLAHSSRALSSNHDNATSATAGVDPELPQGQSLILVPPSSRRAEGAGPEQVTSDGEFMGHLTLRAEYKDLPKVALVELVESADDWRAGLRVRDGHWSGALPVGAYAVKSVTVSGEETPFQAVGGLSPENPDLVIKLLQDAPYQVDLVDGATGQALSSGLVIRAFAGSLDKLSLADVLRRSGKYEACPISLWPTDGTILVSADGYEARAIRLPAVSERFSVALRQVGGAKVMLPTSGVQQDQGEIRLCLESEDNPVWSASFSSGKLSTSPIFTGGTVSIDDIPVGHYRGVARECAPVGWRCGVIVAEASFDVSRQAVAKVTMRALQSEPASLSVVVLQDSREAIDVPGLECRVFVDAGDELQLLGRGSLWEHDPAILAWRMDLTGLQPGRYLLDLMPYGATKEVTMASGAEEKWLFDPAETASLEIGCSPSPVSGATTLLSWGYEDEDRRLGRVHPFDAAGTMRLRCIGKPLWIQAFSGELSSRKVSVAPTPGSTTRIELEMDQVTPGVLLLPSQSEKVMPLDPNYWRHISLLPRGSCSGRHVTNLLIEEGGVMGVFAVVSESGEYTLRLPHLPELGASGRNRSIPIQIPSGTRRMEIGFGLD